MRKILMMLAALVALTFSSCRKGQPTDAGQQADNDKEEKYWNLIALSWGAEDDYLLPVIDSLEAAGELTAARADFARGVNYDHARHIRVGENYYAKAYENTTPEKEGWEFYLEVADRLAQIRMTMSDYKGSMEVATKMLDCAEKAGKLTDRWKIGFLWSIALCQSNLGLAEADETSLQVYQLLEKKAKNQNSGGSVNLLIFTYNIIDGKLKEGKYDEAELWLKKAEDLLEQNAHTADSAIVSEYTGWLALMRVQLLEGQHKGLQAYAFFRKSLPLITVTPECTSDAAEYLLERKRYTEAANLYNLVDSIIPADNRESEVNLNNIGKHDIPRLKANIGAGRKDSVMAIARRIAENYNLALERERKSDATEVAIVYDMQNKNMEIARQKTELSRQRTWAMGITIALLLAFFIVYTEYRRRAANRLGAAHVQLQNAYYELEETTAVKERIESELRIARDIQMSMVPGLFPEREGLDMYAEMMPAKEVGGDLYGYVMKGDVLYFCVGDVSGKGVPASLFMAQSARLFRTLATEGMMPDAIATRMNNELAEGNDNCMFVTMFIGMLHLDTGRLDYCNCGHNAPLLDGQFLEMKYVNRLIGLGERKPFSGETIDDIRGRQLIIYTDGLNEATNRQHEQLGNNRLLELMTDIRKLDSRQAVDMLKKAVEQHRAGEEPNDDLTLMCIRLKGIK